MCIYVALLLLIAIAGDIPLDPALLITGSPFDFKMYRGSIYNVIRPGQLTDIVSNMFSQMLLSMSKKEPAENTTPVNSAEENKTLPRGLYWESQQSQVEDFYDLFYEEDTPRPGPELWEGEEGVEPGGQGKPFNYDDFNNLFGPPTDPAGADGNET